MARDGEDPDSFTNDSKLRTMFQRGQTFNSRQHERRNVPCKCYKQTSRTKKETAVNLEKDPQLAELNPRQEPHGLFKRKVSLMAMPASTTPRLHGRVRPPPPAAEPPTSAESWSLLASNEAFSKNNAAGWSSHGAFPLPWRCKSLFQLIVRCQFCLEFLT